MCALYIKNNTNISDNSLDFWKLLSTALLKLKYAY